MAFPSIVCIFGLTQDRESTHLVGWASESGIHLSSTPGPKDKDESRGQEWTTLNMW